MSNSVLVRKLKYDGSVRSEWEGELLAVEADEWLVVLHHPERHQKWQHGERARADILMVHCLNAVRPITILLGFDANGHFNEAKCDAALPAIHNEQLIKFVDLDLDVIVNNDLTYYVRDQKQFEQNRARMSIPDNVVSLAHRGIDIANTLVQTRSFPFDSRFVPQFNF